MQLPKVTEVREIRVLTSQQIAEAYETNTDTIKKNFSNNRQRFIEGKHFIDLHGTELKKFKSEVKNIHLVGNRASHLYLWTEKGALLHAKSLNTDKAWEVYDYLVDFYFRQQACKPARQQEPEQKRSTAAVLDIPVNEQAQKLIKEMRCNIAGMEAVLPLYNRYHDTESFAKVAYVLKGLGGRIDDIAFSLAAFKPQKIEKIL